MCVLDNSVRDPREHEKMMNAFKRHDELLGMSNRVAGILLESEQTDFDNIIRHCLEMIGGAVEADRASIWVNSTKNGLLYCAGLHEWRTSAESPIGRLIMEESLYDAVIPGWEEKLSSGRYISGLVRDMPPVVRAHMTKLGIKALCVMPIFVYGHFWGFMALDYCHEGRRPDVIERDILRSCSIMVVTAILRYEMRRSIQAELKETLKSVLP
jgi:GAF domain-containing protein